MGNFNFGSQGGTLKDDKQKQFNDRLDNALIELDAKNSQADFQGASPFNSSMSTNAVLQVIEGGEADKAAAFMDSAEIGFGYQCSEDDGVKNYKLALKDFNYHAQMTGMLLNLQAFLDIQKHEEGFKAIPVAVAREAFLKSYNKPEVDIILPNDTKASLGAIKEKHMKLMELKEALGRIRNARGDVIEDRKEAAEDLLKEYRSLKVEDELKQLVEEAKLDKSFLESPITGGLDSVENFLKFDTANDAGIQGRQVIAQRNIDVDLEIKQLEDVTHKQYEALLKEVYNSSGNIKGSADANEYVAEFFSKSREDLMNRSIEATGWSFDMDMKFDLMANVIEARPEIDQQAVYGHMQSLLSTSTDPNAKKAKDAKDAKDATALIRNYQQLEYLKGDKFFKEIFGDRVAELESTINLDEESVGEASSFRMFIAEMCGGRQCELSDIFNSAYREKGNFGRLVAGMGGMMGISPLDGPTLKKRLDAIHSAKELLKTKFAECNTKVTDENLKAAIKVKQEDYIKCELLQGVISTSGLGGICGEDSAAYAAQKRIDDAAAARDAAGGGVTASVTAE